LVNGSIKVFNPTNGNLVAILDNEEVQNDAMPISRIRFGTRLIVFITKMS